MALVNALNSGISGIKAQQTRMDVLGNNLANVDTTGFKGSRALFESVMAQTLRFGAAPSGNLGGINSMQLGLGVNVAEVAKDFSQGTLKATGIATDLAIDGDGFFVQKNGLGENVYTRAGAFTLNPQNIVHNAANGYKLQGYMADFESFEVPSGGPLMDVTIPVGELTIAKKTSNVQFDGNLNAGGEIASLGSILESEQLYDSLVSTSSTASDATLLTDLVRSTTGASDGLAVDLNLQLGDKIELTAQKGGRTITRTFEVGAPPPYGGSTLGDLRGFIEGTLGIATGGASGSELLSSVRQSEKSGNADALFLFTPVTGQANLVDFNDAALTNREEGIIINVPGSTGSHLFYFDDSTAGAEAGNGTFDNTGTTLTTASSVPAGNQHAITPAGTFAGSLQLLADEINLQLGSSVSASIETIGGTTALKLTSLQIGPAGNLISFENGLGDQSSNIGQGSLSGGVSSIDVNGTVDFAGDKSYLAMQFVGTESVGGAGSTLSLFADDQVLTLQTTDGTAVEFTASDTGPTTGNQFEIETLLTGTTGQEAFENNLQTIKNLANAINQNSFTSKEVVATVKTVGTNIQLVLEAVKSGTSGNNFEIATNSGGDAHLGDTVDHGGGVTGANIRLFERSGDTPASSGNTYALQSDAGAPGTVEGGANVALQDGGTNKDTISVIRQNVDGTSDVAYTVPGTDFVAEGVQIGDFIRFASGSEAGTIGVVTAVGTNTLTSSADKNRIEFRVAAGELIPSSNTPGGQTWYIHEAAGVSIGTGTGGEDTTSLDPTSPRGSIRIAGNVGKSNEIRDLSLVKIDQGGARTQVTTFKTLTEADGESTFSQFIVYDSLGHPRTVNMTTHLESTSDRGTVWRFIAESEENSTNPGVDVNKIVGSGTVEFDMNGQFVRMSPGIIELKISATGAINPVQITPDWSMVTAFADSLASTPVGNQKSEVFLASQDGFEEGTLRDFNIAADGLITGSFSNGLTRDLGQIALARFNNNGGLIDIGGNAFREGVNSGQATIGVAGQAGRGGIRSGFLEESNVDLSEVFTELIVAQRAFQANARTVTSADLLLTELVNLVR
ncbi:MAG: flagellar hook-basal body complex protein [Planctomycetes bacterium]|nr:flagellar hook-basal body complex protein [Planctomycetota bacterium]